MIDQALQHPAVRSHPAIKALAKEQARLGKAKVAQLERTQAADAEYRQALVAWQLQHDQAVLEGRPQLPPKPTPPVGTNAQQLLVDEGVRLADAARDVLAGLAPEMVLKVAAYLDSQLADVKAGPVAAVPDALAAVNQSRRACWDIARTRWAPGRLPTAPEPIDVGQLVTLALGPAGVFSDMWGAVVEADRQAGERAVQQAAEMAALAEKAAAQQGKMVSEGLGTAEPLPVEIVRVPIGRR